jgi:precorrin-6B methylase 2
MASLLEQQATIFLTSKLGRAPTAEEIRLATISPYTLSNLQNMLDVGQSVLSITPTDNIQTAINKVAVSDSGTGTLKSAVVNNFL